MSTLARVHLRRLASVLLVMVALVGPACSDDDAGDDDASPAAGSADSTTTSTTAAADSPQEVANTITLRNFSFDPERLQIGKGAVAINLVNTGSAPHTFTVDNPKLDSEVPAGANSQLLVSIPEAGEYTFYCRFHRSEGMEGTLVVS